MNVIELEARRALLERRAALADRTGIVEAVEIDAALARIEAGTYGRCEACGGAIGRQRLRAISEVRLCLSCTARLPG